jgi:hypothetical protein
MGAQRPENLSDRVEAAGEDLLRIQGYAAPIALMVRMGWLAASQVQHWERGRQDCLESSMQCSREKQARALALFTSWAASNQLIPVEAGLRTAGREGIRDLQVTAQGEPETERLFRTCYAPADLSPRKLEALKRKLNKPPDLAVFKTVADEVACQECGAEIARGDFLFREGERTLCLGCADLDHLVFLPSGDAALSRRARKHSALAALVLEFSRRARRYERRGILVTRAAMARAEEECLSDADRRAARRERDVVRRERKDQDLVRDMTDRIRALFPGCPAEEAADIANHTALRGSGRVGRSAAGRQLQDEALRLAVVAHIRHEHTAYDSLLMGGCPRPEARRRIGDALASVLAAWEAGRAAGS